MMVPGESDTAWIADVHPQRIVDLLSPRLTLQTADRMRAHRRLRAPLAAMLAPALCGEGITVPPSARFELGRPDDADRAVRLARMVGAVFHGKSLRGLLSGAVLAQLAERIGREPIAIGVRLAEFGAADAVQGSADEIAAAVDRDGPACLAAWAAQQPGDMTAGLLLALPPALAEAARAPTAAHRTAASTLVDAVLRVMSSEGETA
jgi:hypothetical protein